MALNVIARCLRGRVWVWSPEGCTSTGASLEFKLLLVIGRALCRVRPTFEVKVGSVVLNAPELVAMLCRQWSSQWTPLSGFPASIQAFGSWRTKKPYLPHESQSAVALVSTPIKKINFCLSKTSEFRNLEKSEDKFKKANHL
jgi:hypothetical protein